MCFKKKITSSPKFLYDMDKTELSNLLSIRFPGITIAISDETYKLCFKQNIEDFVKTIKISHIPGGDCDDRVFIMLAEVKKSVFNVIPFGFTWVDTGSNLHAINLFIDDKKDLYVVEPQSSTVLLFPNNYKPYLVVI